MAQGAAAILVQLTWVASMSQGMFTRSWREAGREYHADKCKLIPDDQRSVKQKQGNSNEELHHFCVTMTA